MVTFHMIPPVFKHINIKRAESLKKIQPLVIVGKVLREEAEWIFELHLGFFFIFIIYAQCVRIRAFRRVLFKLIGE